MIGIIFQLLYQMGDSSVNWREGKRPNLSSTLTNWREEGKRRGAHSFTTLNQRYRKDHHVKNKIVQVIKRAVPKVPFVVNGSIYVQDDYRLTRTDVNHMLHSSKRDITPNGITCHGHRIRNHYEAGLCLECMEGWCDVNGAEHCCCIRPVVAIPEIAVDQHGMPLPIAASLSQKEGQERIAFRATAITCQERQCVDGMCDRCAQDIHKGFNGPGFDYDDSPTEPRRLMPLNVNNGNFDGNQHTERIIAVRMANWLLSYPNVIYESSYFATVRNISLDSKRIECARGRFSGVEFWDGSQQSYIHRRPCSFYVFALSNANHPWSQMARDVQKLIALYCTPNLTM